MRIPLLCLVCGNAVMTLRDLDYEVGAMAAAHHGCTVCDPSGEGNEHFYITRTGDVLSFGEWCDLMGLS